MLRFGNGNWPVWYQLAVRASVSLEQGSVGWLDLMASSSPGDESM
jgi:hypothetical protein